MSLTPLQRGADAAAPANPLASASPESITRVGVVAERLRAGTYTYLRVGSGDARPFWIATLGAGAPPGAAVVATSYARATHFTSRRLARHFPVLHFGTIVTQEIP